MDHTWVAHRWIQDLGLPQYSVPLGTHLIDGRLLNVLSKKDMEKHLSIHRKFHQASLLHGVELLRMMHFDKEVGFIEKYLVKVLNLSARGPILDVRI